MQPSATISDRIRQVVLEKFPLAKKRMVKDSDELLESGIVDSLGILDLVAVLETEFRFTVNDEELVPENFRSVDKIAEFTQRKRGSA